MSAETGWWQWSPETPTPEEVRTHRRWLYRYPGKSGEVERRELFVAPAGHPHAGRVCVRTTGEHAILAATCSGQWRIDGEG